MGDVVVGGDLEGVGQRVAVVEQRPPAALALVGSHHLGLDLDAAGDAVVEVHRQQIVTREEVVLRHLAEPAAHLPGRECVERVEVADHPGRLPERARRGSFPPGRLTPVLPPTAASIMPSSVVAT